MNQITITIKMDNAAFTEYPDGEVVRILQDLAAKVFERGLVDMPCMDINGNKVGEFKVQ